MSITHFLLLQNVNANHPAISHAADASQKVHSAFASAHPIITVAMLAVLVILVGVCVLSLFSTMNSMTNVSSVDDNE